MVIAPLQPCSHNHKQRALIYASFCPLPTSRKMQQRVLMYLIVLVLYITMVIACQGQRSRGTVGTPHVRPYAERRQFDSQRSRETVGKPQIRPYAENGAVGISLRIPF